MCMIYQVNILSYYKLLETQPKMHIRFSPQTIYDLMVPQFNLE